MKKIIKSRLFIVVITMVIVASGTLYAANKYQASEVVYNKKDGTTTDVNTALDNIYKSCKKKGNSVFKIGDYVSMTPTSKSYTISNSQTGAGSDQTINPSELNLWRVIKINDDSTVDMVSEYVSSISIYLKGYAAYKNYIGILNSIAKQYENTKYTVGSRHVGYDGQTEYITDTSKFPFKVSTGLSSIEEQGGGDFKYVTDIYLINKAVGSHMTTKVGTTAESQYLVASRFFTYNTTDGSYLCSVRFVSIGSQVYGTHLYISSQGGDKMIGAPVRPIVTLKAGLKPNEGNGTKDSPYILS